jgi:alkylation response protein AidB-like acyl-CoA dehydrogenase
MIPSPYQPGGSFLVEDVAAGDILIPEALDAGTHALAEAAADFMRRAVLPVADRLQAQEPGLMASLLRQAGQLGLMGLCVPEEFGGLALPESTIARIAESLAAEPSFSVSHNVHTSVATLPIVFFGTEEQKARYLPRLGSGEWIGAYALSEAHAGSDALAARCRATPNEDGSYTLTGEKMWITNAAFADLFVVFAKIEGQEKLTAFVVERTSPGVAIGREEHKLGLKGSSTCRLILDSVPVGAENVLGAPGEGAKVALYTLNLGRFKVAASALGQAKILLGIATRYAKQRIAFGKSIAEHGLIQQKLARMAAPLFACESMLYRVAGNLDSAFESGAAVHPAEEFAIECAILKVACTETLALCADECVQIHGGYGYTEEFPAARAWRDARVNRIYEGTNEVNRLNIVQLLLRRIESGRLDMSRTPDARDASPGTVEALRAITSIALESATDAHGADLGREQQVCAALADMLIDLLAVDTSGKRAKRILEMGLSESRWQAALAASRLSQIEADARFRHRIANVFGALGQQYEESREHVLELFDSKPRPTFERERALARAVIVADGYCW